jgi:hypothetical protein
MTAREPGGHVGLRRRLIINAVRHFMMMETLSRKSLMLLAVAFATVFAVHFFGHETRTLSERENKKLVVHEGSSLAVRTNDAENERSFVNVGLSTAEKWTTAKHMMERFKEAREQLFAKLRVDYGEYFEEMFLEGNSSTNGRSLFISPGQNGLSKGKIKRKVLMKLLQVQVDSQTGQRELPSPGLPFVWAVGGHSVTAGHGNFYHESYTAVMERAVKDVLSSTGIQFVGRNYAMGGTTSAPETAFCTKEIYGQDIDVLVYDFFMTDSRRDKGKKMEYFFQRAAMTIPSNPVCLAYHLFDDRNYIAAVKRLELRGLPILYSQQKVIDETEDVIPDTLGMAEDNIQALPKYVRNYKCGNAIEFGDPYCKADKYNDTLCENRLYKAKWHPGFKWQAIMGNLAALFLLDVWEDALTELASRQTVDSDVLLRELQAEEIAEYERFRESAYPEEAVKALVADEAEHDKIDWNLIAKGPNFCHTARIPSEIRYKGILTESGPTQRLTEFTGKSISRMVAERRPIESDMMQLVYEEAEHKDNCTVLTHLDYKESFFVNSDDTRWRKVVVPNDAELSEYGTGQPLRGLIAVCIRWCEFNKCPPLALSFADLQTSLFVMEVNGEAVTNITHLKSSQDRCVFLKRKSGYYWTPNEAGRFEIWAKVLKFGRFLRFSSFVVW